MDLFGNYYRESMFLVFVEDKMGMIIVVILYVELIGIELDILMVVVFILFVKLFFLRRGGRNIVLYC